MTRQMSRAEFKALQAEPKPSKWKNKGHYDVDGVWWACAREEKRWHELKILERDRKIKNLQRQKTFILHGVNGSIICRYRADFYYQEFVGMCAWFAEDSKGALTPEFKIKKKLFEDEYGMELLCV